FPWSVCLMFQRNRRLFEERSLSIVINPLRISKQHCRTVVTNMLLVILLAACAAQPPTVVVDNTPLKGKNDVRDYRYLQLDNGLKVVLVSDPASDIAAASMDVFAGSGDDPVERQGLAHFLEHMLFLGTARYPQP